MCISELVQPEPETELPIVKVLHHAACYLKVTMAETRMRLEALLNQLSLPETAALLSGKNQ